MFKNDSKHKIELIFAIFLHLCLAVNCFASIRPNCHNPVYPQHLKATVYRRLEGTAPG